MVNVAFGCLGVVTVEQSRIRRSLDSRRAGEAGHAYRPGHSVVVDRHSLVTRATGSVGARNDNRFRLTGYRTDILRTEDHPIRIRAEYEIRTQSHRIRVDPAHGAI